MRTVVEAGLEMELKRVVPILLSRRRQAVEARYILTNREICQISCGSATQKRNLNSQGRVLLGRM
jgi:anion-transporting  ArsA/GET3 family ATPase